MSSSELSEAADRLSEHARTECGFDPDAADDDLAAAATPGEAAEPPDACAFVDAGVVVDAAGVDADVTDQDGGGTVNLGVYATDGCSYANGAVSISTITFAGDMDDVVQSHVDSAEDNGGRVVTDVDLGTLPDSTVVTEVHGYMSITVLDATSGYVGRGGMTDRSRGRRRRGRSRTLRSGTAPPAAAGPGTGRLTPRVWSPTRPHPRRHRRRSAPCVRAVSERAYRVAAEYIDAPVT